MQNKALVVFNLQEVVEILNEIIDEAVAGEEYSEDRLKKSMGKAYQHLNYAWHIHSELEKNVEQATQENFIEWSKMPVGEITEYR